MAIDEVTIPSEFSPTQLVRALACPLSTVLSNIDELEPLPRGPLAVLGTLLHQLVEDSARGRIENQETVEKSCADHLAKLLAEKNASLLQHPATAHLPPIEKTVPYDERQRRFRLALKAAIRRHRPRSDRTSAITGESKAVRQSGVEVLVKSETLRVRGRVDGWDLEGDTRVISDLKTGRHGVESEAVRFQLELYGLLALESEPSRDVRLVVDRGTIEEVPFGQSERTAARHRLDRLLEIMPSGQAIRAVDLARPGEACGMCAFRHRCGAYQSHAERAWLTELVEPLPNDCWGVVRHTEATDGFLRLEIKDAAGRIVIVRRLDPDRFPLARIQHGCRVWLFGLLADGGRRTMSGALQHPQVFCEREGYPGTRRAYELAIFIAPECEDSTRIEARTG